ncbi:hypothetical protein IEQ34_001079 [Dendrobium chrysotoxum]|uniref:Uncharacterized protein n=1 Tax=Dendrobium chrysotoxum TaxID=161865 RepID=A0AAV7HLJ7_DENCH|nr:hypothetical protein IEQ34_001079 [Dendrobium chrysotoxum]
MIRRPSPAATVMAKDNGSRAASSARRSLGNRAQAGASIVVDVAFTGGRNPRRFSPHRARDRLCLEPRRFPSSPPLL